jgi:cytochrome P450
MSAESSQFYLEKQLGASQKFVGEPGCGRKARVFHCGTTMMNNVATEPSSNTAGNAALQQPIVRPETGLKAKIAQWFFDNSEIPFSLLRSIAPIAVVKRKHIALVTRYDDVKEVFRADDAFPVVYASRLKKVTGETPFIFGMEDGPDYRRDNEAMRSVIRYDDIDTRLAPKTKEIAERLVAAAGGRIDFVDFIRQVTFEVMVDYFGVPPNGDLKLWTTRLFQYMCHVGDDPELDKEADAYGEALRADVREAIKARKDAPAMIEDHRDDVLGRCLKAQAADPVAFSDDKICASIVGFLLAGLPQPPTVLPKALEQLLRRSKMLGSAQLAARNGDEETVRRYIFEAMRFDPLAPFVPRVAKKEHVLAAGTPRAKKIEVGTHVLVAFASAMMDDRRVRNPRSFNPNRSPNDYMLFGHGLHECFAKRINEKLLPLMLMPLLKRNHLVRARGQDGHLRKQGTFPDRLTVCFDP